MADVVHTELAARLSARRARLAERLASFVAEWPKYAEEHAADPAGFAVREYHSLVDYVARWLDSGDDDFLHLYIGEKAKQFHDRSVDQAECMRREAILLAEERAAFVEALDDARPIHVFFDAVQGALQGETAANARVLFVGDCLFLDVVAFLTGPALADGVRLDSDFVASHDPVNQRAAIARLVNARFDAIFFSPFTYAALNEYGDLQRPRVAIDPRAVGRGIAAAADAASDVLTTLAELFECPIFVHAPAPIMRHGHGIKERLGMLVTAPTRRLAARILSARIRSEAARHNETGARVHVIEETALVAAVGLEKAGRFLHRSFLQHPARFGAIVAAHYRDIVFAVVHLAKRKLIACDLDNTLWEGVIGEGLGVRHHRDRQAVLLELKRRGVVLAINSKNDPAKVIWDGGALVADDFVSHQINWDPKPVNIRRIAQHLNLKEKDFVFIDDRADERAMVMEQAPGLLALDALDRRTWRLMTLWRDLLLAKPGADRTEFYRQRDARQTFLAEEGAQDAAQRAVLYADIALSLSIRVAATRDLARVAELINRTNQFNMTGARLSARQVEEYAASPDTRIMIADAADRFGKMGTVAVVIAIRQGMNIDIPVFVLSCRVFGYDMEYAILETARLLAAPGEALTGRLIETPVNQPCRTVYATAGMVADGTRWRLADAAKKAISVPDWLQVDRSIEPFDQRA